MPHIFAPPLLPPCIRLLSACDFTRARERLCACRCGGASSLVVFQLRKAGWLRETADPGEDGYPRYRRDVTYLREKNRRNERNLPLVLADSSRGGETREATSAEPICRNIRRKRCFSLRMSIIDMPPLSLSLSLSASRPSRPSLAMMHCIISADISRDSRRAEMIPGFNSSFKKKITRG